MFPILANDTIPQSRVTEHEYISDFHWIENMTRAFTDFLFERVKVVGESCKRVAAHLDTRISIYKYSFVRHPSPTSGSSCVEVPCTCTFTEDEIKSTNPKPSQPYFSGTNSYTCIYALVLYYIHVCTRAHQRNYPNARS